MGRKIYDLLAPLYDLGIWFLTLSFGGEGRFRQKVLENLGTAAGGHGAKVLELFAGTGTLSLMAAKNGADAVLLDLSGGMLRVAREKSGAGAKPLKLVRGDAKVLPFTDCVFDAVIASMGLHETAQEKIPAIISEAGRVLKKGGVLLIFDFHRAEGLAGYIQRLFFIFVEGETASRWVRMDLQGLLREAGFRNFKRQFLLNRSLQSVTVEKI